MPIELTSTMAQTVATRPELAVVRFGVQKFKNSDRLVVAVVLSCGILVFLRVLKLRIRQ
jgi:hypothetical protein